jgi:hypothetical protein
VVAGYVNRGDPLERTQATRPPATRSSLDQGRRSGALSVEAGPRGALTVLELEVVTWLCSRWREHGDPAERRVPLSLSQLAGDFGWADDGPNLRRLRLALDRPPRPGRPGSAILG